MEPGTEPIRRLSSMLNCVRYLFLEFKSTTHISLLIEAGSVLLAPAFIGDEVLPDAGLINRIVDKLSFAVANLAVIYIN